YHGIGIGREGVIGPMWASFPPTEGGSAPACSTNYRTCDGAVPSRRASRSILSSIPGIGLMGGWAQATHSATITATLAAPIHFPMCDDTSSFARMTPIGPWSTGAQQRRAIG